MTKEELRDPKILRKIGELRSAEMPWDKIRLTLEESGIKTTIPTIQNAYNIYVARSSEIIAGDEALKGVLKEAVFDVAEKLKKVGRVMDTILDQARTTPDQKIAASKEILNQLYFQEKILNRIQSGFDFSKISKIEYTKVSTINLEELDKADNVIIIKKPGMPPLSPSFINKIRSMIADEYDKFNKVIDIKKEEWEDDKTDKNERQDAQEEE